MGQALYRKYRSKSLDEVVGQSHITDMLRRAIASGNVAHAYLLTGPRGVGKTSIARILAHEINRLPYNDESTHLDIIEIDAASNNSVEDIRNLRDKVAVAPTSAPKKIYIIDEVHMLSKSAFNALLKTLEEPPEHVVFILATTDVEKLPATIVSRVQRFNFRLIDGDDAVKHLRAISDAENIDINDEALQLVARHGQGSFRDSISLLDQLRNLSDSTITPELIENVVGLASNEMVLELLNAYDSQNLAKITELIDNAERRGISAITITDQLVHAVRTDITAHPERLPLLDKLLEVAKSAWPFVKLITALTSNTIHTATPAVAPTPVVVAQKATSTPSVVPKPAVKPTPKPTTKPKSIETPTPKAPEKPVEPPKPLGPEQPFPWAEFVTNMKVSSPGAHSILGKCDYSFDGTTLTIFAGKPFTKKQLDKSLPTMQSVLESVGVQDGIITVLETTKPSDNSTIAAALDIMGGGEEVAL
ncbi:MAG TPA: DNA polymerase III subunit gamma/tau [Patescibacteria group bacterium]|nr:DNA polymerase III subunit gamma/tau [Patescibacteria group bacterium]